MAGGETLDPLGVDGAGVLPSQCLAHAIDAGWIDLGPDGPTPTTLQPASIDLHLGEVAYPLRCSFLPDQGPVEEKLRDYVIDEVDLRGGAVLHTGRPYLIPIVEHLDLPDAVRARTNPKSSTGRLDVLTRVISDGNRRFDEVRAGYRGRLWLEVVPLSFTVRVEQGLALNQLRLIRGEAALSDAELRATHDDLHLVFLDGEPVPAERLEVANGLFLGLDLVEGRASAGYRAKRFTPPIDMTRVDHYDARDFWDDVVTEEHDRIVLEPGAFYLLLSDESVSIPPGLAAEMTAYDPTSGELRTHYAGFFDPGFGFDPHLPGTGSKAALEVRAHDVPFVIERRQPVCKLTFEHMLRPPTLLYGQAIGSSYQGQTGTLGKHFRRAAPPPPRPHLFDEPAG